MIREIFGADEFLEIDNKNPLLCKVVNELRSKDITFHDIKRGLVKDH